VIVLLFLVFTYGVSFSYLTIMRHYAYQSTCYDLGNTEKLLWSTINEGSFFESTVYYPTRSEFSFHFVPVWFLVLLFYAIYQAPETLLVLQSFCLALGAIPIFLLSRREVDDLTGIGLAALYLLNPILHWINWFDFHTEALSIPFLLFSFYYIRTGRFCCALLFAFLAVCSTEPAALTLLGLGAYTLWTNRKRISRDITQVISARWFLSSLVLLLLGGIWIPLSILVISMFGGHLEIFAQRYGYLGTTPQDVIVNTMVKIPAIITSILGDRSRVDYLIQLLIPMAFLSLFDMAVVMIPAGNVVVNLLSSFEPQHSIRYQYTAPILPFILMATISGLRKAKSERGFHKQLLAIMFVATVMQAYLQGPIGVSNIPSRTAHDAALDSVLTLIPRNASVSTQNDIFPHVAQRSNVFLRYSNNVEYIIMDTTSPWYREGVSPEDSKYYEILPGVLHEYGVIASVDGVVLLKANYSGPLLLPYRDGLFAQFFNNRNLAGPAVFSTVVLNVNQNWGLGSPFPTVNTDNFSATFEGRIFVPKTGIYTLILAGDDGSRLYLDQLLLIDGWGNLPSNKTVTMPLEKGWHEIRIDYLECTYFSSIQLLWVRPDGKKEIVPRGYFSLPNHFAS